MEDKKCNCEETCTCGCQEGKECTCNCGCQDGEKCTCGEHCECDDDCKCNEHECDCKEHKFFDKKIKKKKRINIKKLLRN